MNKIIPNPFDKSHRLSELAKKGELIKESLSFHSIARNIIFLIIIGLVFINYFKFPFIIVGILIGVEILVNLISGYIRIQKLKSIWNIKTQDNAKSYRNLLITAGRYEMIKSVFGIIADTIAVVIIFLFFSNEISDFIVQNIPLNLVQNVLNYLIWVFVIFRIFEFILRIIRYNWIKKLKESNDFAEINREYILIERKLQLINFVPSVSVFLLIFFLIGIPLYIILIFAGFMFLMIALSIVELLRIKNVKFNEVLQNKIKSYPNEKIEYSVFGILKSAVGFSLKPFGFGFLGVGKSYFPENTLLVTNRRLLFIQVPVTGGNKIIDQTNYVQANFFYNRKEIREKGEEMLKTNSVNQILKFATNEVLYEDIKKLILKQTQIIIEKTNGKKISYTFIDKEYLNSLKELLNVHLKEKFLLKSKVN